MEKIQDIRIFANAKMDLDKDVRYLQPNEHREIWNSIVNVSDSSGVGCLQNIKGTSSVFDLPINSGFVLPATTLVCHGACEDINSGTIIYFLCDTVGVNHCIFRMHTYNYKCEWILKYDFNFKQDHKISANIIGDLLYFTDGYEGEAFIDYNPPRKVNVVKAIAYTNAWSATTTYYNGMIAGSGGKCYRYINSTGTAGNLVTDTDYWELANKYDYTTINEQVLNRIKPAPYFDILNTYLSDSTFNYNNLRGKLFQFRYRWIYADGEKSVWSGISPVKYPDSDERVVDELVNGAYSTNAYINNTIQLVVATGYEEVVRIEIASRKGNNGIWSLVETIDKYESDGARILNDNTIKVIKFRNDKGTIPLDQADTERLYDAVPQISAGEESIEKNRLLDYDYTEGYDNTELDATITSSEVALDPAAGTWNTDGSYPAYDVHAGGVYSGAFGSWIEFPANIADNQIISVVIYRYFYPAFNAATTVPPTWLDLTNAVKFDIQTTKLVGETTADLVTRLILLINSEVSSTFVPPNGVIQTMAVPYLGNANRIFIVTQTKVADAGHDSHGYQLWDMYFVQSLQAFSYGITERELCFKSGAKHFFGIEYLDDNGRNGFVNTSEDTEYTIPYLTETHGNGYHEAGGELILHGTKLSWSLSNPPPLWAKYYRWVYGGCSTVFHFTVAVPYANIFDDGTQTFIPINREIVAASENNKAFSLSTYTWQKGDRLRLLAREMTSGRYVYIQPMSDFEILGETLSPDIDRTTNTLVYYDADWYKQDKSDANTPGYLTDENGNKINNAGETKLVIPALVKSDYLIPGVLTDDKKILVEVYRPRNIGDVTQIVYNEVGALLPIISAHTDGRRHGRGAGTSQTDQEWNFDGTLKNPATGEFDFGNIFVRARIMSGTMFPCEAMEYSDYYQSNDYSIGRPNIVNRNAERTRYSTKLLYGGKYFEESDGRANYVSTVLSSDSIMLPQKYGRIVGAKEVGYTLNILQENKHSALFIGRAGITQPSADSREILTSTKDVLGTLITSDDNYGCFHTNSLCRFEKALYYYDISSGSVLRESTNGTEDISKYGVKDFFKKRSKLLLASGKENVAVYSTYDTVNDIVFFSFLDSKTPANSFTIGFHEPDNAWISFYSFLPEFYGTSWQVMTSFKDGKLWLHNDGVRMNFYGTQYGQSVKTVSNKDAVKIKSFKSVAVSSNKKWNCGVVGDLNIVQNDAYPRGQQSLIMAGSFVSQEGKFRASMGRNMLTTSAVPSNDDYINGNEMRGEAMEVTLRNASTDETKLFTVEVDSIYSFRG